MYQTRTVITYVHPRQICKFVSGNHRLGRWTCLLDQFGDVTLQPDAPYWLENGVVIA